MLTKLSPGEQTEIKTKPKFSRVVAKASKEKGRGALYPLPRASGVSPLPVSCACRFFLAPLAMTLLLIPTGGGFGSSRLGIAALCFPATNRVTEPKARVLQVAKQNPIKRLG